MLIVKIMNVVTAECHYAECRGAITNQTWVTQLQTHSFTLKIQFYNFILQQNIESRFSLISGTKLRDWFNIIALYILAYT